LHDMEDVQDREDAFQNMLIEMYRKPDRFTPVDQDSFFAKINLIRFAYSTHLMKVHRSDLAEEIRILELKDKKYGLSSDEQKHLRDIERIKKKL